MSLHVKRGWRTALRITVRGLTKKARNQGNHRFVKQVLAELKSQIDWLEAYLATTDNERRIDPRRHRSVFALVKAHKEHPDATRKELAQLTGLSLSTVYRYRKGIK